jgi:predicted ATP-dependent endonuclease of OLD family
MYLAQLTISNFRGIKNANINLSGHTILLGNNNSGKSTIIDAIGLLLGKETLVRNINDFDFFGGNPQPDDRILLKGALTGFSSDNETEHAEWFNDNRGGIAKWFDPLTNTIHTEQNEGSTLKLAVELGFAARFDKDDLEFETKRYFYLSDVDPFDDASVVSIPKSLTKKIGFFLIPSKRNWERIISFGSEIFRKVISFQNAIPAESVIATRDELRASESGIEREAPFRDIVERINQEIKGFTGKTMRLNFLPTNTDIESVLHSLTPFLPGRADTNLPLGSHGSGLVSLQTLLLLLEFGRYRKDNNENFILSAEEPELHLHPGMHRRLIGRIRNLSTQTIISTHSPEIAAYYKPQEINIVQTKDDGTTHVVPLITAVPPENALMRLFTVYRRETSEALMNSNIIIPEGITEYQWINRLMSAVVTSEGWDIVDTIKSFGVIPTQDSHVVKTFQTFTHLSRTLIPFVDGDDAGNRYVSSLLRLVTPPRFILQLPPGRMIEHLIAWIIQPTDQQQINTLRTLLTADIDYTNLNELGEFLQTKKSHWQLHDELVDNIMGRQGCLEKVRRFVRALDAISTEEANVPTGWLQQTNSTANTTVLKLNLFD